MRNSEKYDEKLLAHIIMQKCFYGVAFNRSASYGHLSASTLSELFARADLYLKEVYDVILKSAAVSDQISFDDTKSKIQSEEKGGTKTAWASAFVSRDAIVYIIDRNHAGIGLQEILKHRPSYLAPVLALSDALPCYRSYKENCIDLHCLTHGRRRFKDASEDDQEFSDEMIDLIGEIYKIDNEAKKMSDGERMEVHARKSTPVLNEMMDLLQESLEQKRFLPNSDLGRAINYWIEDFNKLSSFTRIPGALLDTNHVERSIKSPIRVRKQAPIYKTVEGARRVGRMLTLTETSRMAKIDPFHYLTWAMKGAKTGVEAIDLTPWAFKQYLEKEKRSPP